MCISTAYEHDSSGAVLAEYITTVSQRDGVVTLIDIMGKRTEIEGLLTSADLAHGILVIEPESATRC